MEARLILAIALAMFSPLLNAAQSSEELVYNACQGDHFTWTDTTLFAYRSYACAPTGSVTFDHVTAESLSWLYVRAPVITLKSETHIKGTAYFIGR